MLSAYNTISFRPAASVAGILGLYDWRIPHLADPATKAVTDFLSHPPLTLEHRTAIKKAKEKMAENQTDFAMVCDDDGNFCGGVCRSDLDTSKQKNYSLRDGLIVRDVMTPKQKMFALSVADLRVSSIGDLLRTLEPIEAQNVLVIFHSNNTDKFIGVISVRELARLFSVPFKQTKGNFQSIITAILARHH
ncbi:MAG: CBS domain-containing protein [Motiliproteus sp.]|nr:CBS domain-containing protein [Motiliproteus sp.]MCW9052621.1 CBS domain-containing protein [Motiliproteus sp.]